ncbi:hypothetical protein BDV93DRAFT_542232 [Ceratobasidium sp. AG-I]|nr:hypothetical protein BDV93DRAFT_542232 [Ceratobasidium sp. AG-I]
MAKNSTDSKLQLETGIGVEESTVFWMDDLGHGVEEVEAAMPTLAASSTLPASRESKAVDRGSPIPDYATTPNAPAHNTMVPENPIFNKLSLPALSPLFTGRANELEYLNEFFHQNNDGELILLGGAGSGKTQLALKFAQMTTLYRWVEFVICVAPACIAHVLLKSNIFYAGAGFVKHTLPELLDQKNLLQVKAALDLMDEQRRSRSEIAAIAPAALTDSPPRVGLVIFDDPAMDSFSYVHFFKGYMAQALGFERFSMLYLLNSSSFPADNFNRKTYYISRSLEVEDAASLLIKSAHLKHDTLLREREETARDIAKCFGCYPAAIVQVGAAIRDSGLTLQMYWSMSDEYPEKQLTKMKRDASLGRLWQHRSGILSEAAYTLLQLLVFLPVNDQPLLIKILTRARANLTNYQPLTLTGPDVERIKNDNERLLALFTTTVGGSIHYSSTFTRAMSEIQKCFTPHSKVPGEGVYASAYAWAKDFISHPGFAGASAAYLLAASVGPVTEREDKCRAFRSNLDSLTRFSLIDEACGHWKKAIALKKSVVEKYKQDLGPCHTETVFATADLAKTYCKIGCWRDAKKVQSTLLGHQEEELGETHPDTLSVMHDLASTLSRMGRWEDAENLLERVCDGRKQTLGEIHPDTLSAMHSLASSYSEQGRWQEALELHENVLETRRRVLGDNHADTLSSMHSLATKHWESGQSTKDAEESNIRVLEARKKVLGLEHPDTFSSLIALSMVYHRQGQWRVATDLATDVLEMQKRTLGRDHIDTIQNMQNLASWYSEHGRLSNATSLYVEILESRRAAYGNNGPETLTTMGELVSIYWKQGLCVQAEGLHRELLSEIKDTLGDDHPTCLATSLDLATHYLGQCRWREASLIFKEVLSVKRQEQEPDEEDREIIDIQQQLDLTLFALSLDVFIISPAVPMESVVTHFTARAGLKDYSSRLQEALELPISPIAWGGFSNIYRVTLLDGSELAVKCLKSAHGEYKQVKQTIRELNTWSQLRHKSIAALLGLALFQGQLAMVSLWNKRGNVMKYMEERPDLDRYALCTQVVNAVVYLHKSDVIHGDLKGANILVSDDGTLQLTDFGLTIIHDATIQFSKSEDRVGGTLRWMAPEIVFGADTNGGSVGPASGSLSETLSRVRESENNPEAAKLCKETDIYALGMTMLVRNLYIGTHRTSNNLVN